MATTLEARKGLTLVPVPKGWQDSTAVLHSYGTDGGRYAPTLVVAWFTRAGGPLDITKIAAFTIGRGEEGSVWYTLPTDIRQVAPDVPAHVVSDMLRLLAGPAEKEALTPVRYQREGAFVAPRFAAPAPGG